MFLKELNNNQHKTIILGGGCFWCIEAVFNRVEGVIEVTSGYAGGATSDPTYEQVLTGQTGHAEVVKLDYDPTKIELEKILEIFFEVHDPTTLNRQGADVGTQYRSVIFYTEAEQKQQIDPYIGSLRQRYTDPIVTEVKELDHFYQAEEYHQKYYEKNPYAGYCQFVIKPKLRKIGA